MSECSDIQAALARLEAKIDACAKNKVDEESIILKSVQRVFSHGKWIALVGMVGFATSEASKIRARQMVQEVELKRLNAQVIAANAKATGALAKAGDALARGWETAKRVGGLEIKYGDLVARVAGLVGAVAGLLGLYGQLEVIIPQLSQLQNRVTTLEIWEVQTFQKAIAANETALRAIALAEKALNAADSALLTAGIARIQAQQALANALRALEIASFALNESGVAKKLADAAKGLADKSIELATSAIAQIPPIKILSSEAKVTADRGIELATSALTQIPPVRDLASQAKSTADYGVSLALSALTAIPPVRDLASQAKSTADYGVSLGLSALTAIPPVRDLAIAAKGIADLAFSTSQSAVAQIPPIRELATNANTTAKDAQGRVRAIEPQVPPIRQTAEEAKTKADNAQKTAWNTIEIAEIADTKATEAKVVGSANSTRIGKAEAKIEQLETQVKGQGNPQVLDKRVHELEKKQKKEMTPDQYQKIFEDKLKPDLIRDIVTAGGLAAFPIVVQATQKGIASSAPALQAAAAAGVCSTTRPGGCMNKALDGLGNDLWSKFDRGLNGFNAVSNGVQLGMLNGISNQIKGVDRKLGAQLPGGIGDIVAKLFGRVTEISTLTG